MAEFVQGSIEEMLSELEQMHRVGLFTKPEIRRIVQNRKAYEYKLRRRTKSKEDFLPYIQYEINLLNLVKKRRERTGYNFKKLEIDMAIVRRIHRLFRSAIFRFQDDVNLWLTHIGFCKQRRENTLVGKQYARMLQVHGKKPDLWVQAAKWEFESNNKSENARSLLQRALRFNPTSKQLWLEYYRLELLFAEMMIERRKILGVTTPGTQSKSQDAILSGQVAMVAYKQALQAIPDDIEFLLAFLAVCQLFDFTQEQEEEMYNDLQILHANKPLTWDALAARCLKRKAGEEDIGAQDAKFHRVYGEAVQSLQNDEIWSLYLKACLQLVQTTPKGSKKLQTRRIQKVLSLFAEANNSVTLSPSLWQQWLELLCSVGLPEKAVQVSELATESQPTSVSLWKRRLEITAGLEDSADKFLEVFKQAEKCVPQKESWPVVELALEFCMQSQNPDQVVKLLENAMFGCKEVSLPAKEFYLNWEFLNYGVAQAREIYDRLAKCSPKSVKFFHEYIKMESIQEKPKVKLMRKAYEDAVREFGSSEPDLWLDYIKLETGNQDGKPEKAGEIYHRAVKTLQGQCNQEFIKKYTMYHTGREA